MEGMNMFESNMDAIYIGGSAPFQKLNISFENVAQIASVTLSGTNAVRSNDENFTVGDHNIQWSDGSIWINPYDTQTAPNANPWGIIPEGNFPIPAIMPPPAPLTPEQMAELVAEAFRKLKEMPPEERRELEEAHKQKVNPTEPKRKKPRRMIQT